MRPKSHRLLAKVLLVSVLLLLLIGCTPTTVPKGWAGGAVSDSNLFVGSMTGKLVALNTGTGARVWPQDFSLSGPTQGGLGILSCGQGSSAVAIYGTPVAADGLVYVTGYNGKVYAVSSDSGASRWTYPRDGTLKPIVGGLAVSQGKVYFGGTDGRVYALDATTGDQAWPPFQTGEKVWSTPVVSGDTLYIGSFDDRLYALDAASGSKKWDFKTEGAIASTPLVYENAVYFGSLDRHLYALNLDGTLKWRSDFISDKWFRGDAVAYGNAIYASSLGGKVYVVDAGTGSKIAEANLGASITSSPVVVGKLVVVVTETGVVYALDTSTNQARLVTNLKTEQGNPEKVDAPLSAAGGVVFVHTQTSQHEAVYALNPETGQTLWRIQL